jgi:hypothetical protein
MDALVVVYGVVVVCCAFVRFVSDNGERERG